MRKTKMRNKAFIGATCAVAASVAATGAANAGGFEVREQSAFFQGMSFAGAAAGGSLSSIFWNPAASGIVEKGITFESAYSLIIPNSELTVTGISGIGGAPAGAGLNAVEFAKDREVEIGRLAVVPATYAAWRGEIDPRIVFAVSMNSQFGLGTKPDNTAWSGEFWQQAAKIFSINVAPSMSYQVTKGVTLAAGLQFQHFELKHYKVASLTPGVGLPLRSASFDAQDFGIGFTLGAMFTPASGTKLGIGYRSRIDHDLTGSLRDLGGGPTIPIAAELSTPDKITASFEQAISPNLRLDGTVEWTHWSLEGIIPITSPVAPNPATLDLQWHDGWLFALGGEYDYSSNITLRAGAAYEISPIQNASERLLQLPDADRIWASMGATYKWNEAFTFDFAYSHVFVEDAAFSRHPATNALSAALITGTAESSVDIVTVGVRSKW